MKRLIYLTHSWLGIIAGLALLVIGLTGSILVFKREIDQWMSPGLVLSSDPSGARLPHDEYFKLLQSNLPDQLIAGWGMATEKGLADAAYVIPVGTTEGRMIYVDPATASPRGSGETVGDWLLKLHYSFFADHVGEFLAGLFGVVFCLLSITGVIIYRKFWMNLFRLRWHMSARIFFSDLHKMVGISSTVFNLLLGLTGAWWNLSHLLAHATEEAPEPVVKTVARHWSDGVSIDRLVAAARETLPGYQANWISLPREHGGDVMMFGATEGQGVLRSPYGSTVVFNGETGDLKSATAARDAGLGEQILDAFRPLHFGNFGGLPVKILWCLGGLAPAALAISGSILWWRRKNR
jgi:uncharacterized iron-regulated membrane protein